MLLPAACPGDDGLGPTQKGLATTNPSCGDIKGVATAIAEAKNAETVVSLFKNPESPMEFRSATHGPDDLLRDGKIRNLSDKNVTKYRIGYFTVASDGSTQAMIGVDMNVPGKIKPFADARVPAQGVPATLLGQVKGVAFFVAYAEFDDGSTWNADVSAMRKTLQSLVSQKQ